MQHWFSDWRRMRFPQKMDIQCEEGRKLHTSHGRLRGMRASGSYEDMHPHLETMAKFSSLTMKKPIIRVRKRNWINKWLSTLSIQTNFIYFGVADSENGMTKVGRKQHERTVWPVKESWILHPTFPQKMFNYHYHFLMSNCHCKEESIGYRTIGKSQGLCWMSKTIVV